MAEQTKKCPLLIPAVRHFKVPCISFIPSLNAPGQQQYAMKALGKQAQKTEFYASLYQKKKKDKLKPCK